MDEDDKCGKKKISYVQVRSGFKLCSLNLIDWTILFSIEGPIFNNRYPAFCSP